MVPPGHVRGGFRVQHVVSEFSDGASGQRRAARVACTASGGAFSISGTIAQPDADPLQPSTARAAPAGGPATTRHRQPAAHGGSHDNDRA